MTLPSSFPISVSQINVELGRAGGAAFNIQGSAERALAKVPSGPISMSDFLGKSSFSIAGVSQSGGVYNVGAYSAGRAIIVAYLFNNDGSPTPLSSLKFAGASTALYINSSGTYTTASGGDGGGSITYGGVAIGVYTGTATSGSVTATSGTSNLTSSGIGVFKITGFTTVHESVENETDGGGRNLHTVAGRAAVYASWNPQNVFILGQATTGASIVIPIRAGGISLD